MTAAILGTPNGAPAMGPERLEAFAPESCAGTNAYLRMFMINRQAMSEEGINPIAIATRGTLVEDKARNMARTGEDVEPTTLEVVQTTTH